MAATLLVADDKANEREAIAELLRSNRFGVLTAGDSVKALSYVHQPIDMVIAEPQMSDGSGMDLLGHWHKLHPSTPFIMVASHGDIGSAVRAMKLGARDYLGRPFQPDELLRLVRKHLTERPPVPRGRTGFEKIIGTSQAMLDIYDRVEHAARSNCTVVVTGESGTGKELIAEAIHRNSPRCNGPFVTTNMAAVPENLMESELFGHIEGAFTGAAKSRIGRFEAANRGTIFIDEIGDLRLASQAKLLRVLETRRITPVGSNDDREVDVRVVAATNRSLEKMIATHEFREDLYYRLKVVTIALPPLRERREDIPLLVDCFLDHFAGAYQLPPCRPDAQLSEFLLSYEWPGNVRQLRNCIESMVVLSDDPTLTVDGLPESIRRRERRDGDVNIPLGWKLEELKKLAVQQALERCDGHRVDTARSLGISVRTLHRHLRRWNLE